VKELGRCRWIAAAGRLAGAALFASPTRCASSTTCSSTASRSTCRARRTSRRAGCGAGRAAGGAVPAGRAAAAAHRRPMLAMCSARSLGGAAVLQPRHLARLQPAAADEHRRARRRRGGLLRCRSSTGCTRTKPGRWTGHRIFERPPALLRHSRSASAWLANGSLQRYLRGAGGGFAAGRIRAFAQPIDPHQHTLLPVTVPSAAGWLAARDRRRVAVRRHRSALHRADRHRRGRPGGLGGFVTSPPRSRAHPAGGRGGQRHAAGARAALLPQVDAAGDAAASPRARHRAGGAVRRGIGGIAWWLLTRPFDSISGTSSPTACRSAAAPTSST
jgi:hypothetical protein